MPLTGKHVFGRNPDFDERPLLNLDIFQRLENAVFVFGWNGHNNAPIFRLQQVYALNRFFGQSFFSISIFLNSSPSSSTGVSRINAFARSFG